jgi:4'-phosphopantetheinyl transferase
MSTHPSSDPIVLERDCETLPASWIIPALREGEVHVWRQSLSLNPTVVASFISVLSDDEQIRAQRFRFDIGRTEFIVSRGTLRLLIEAYQGISARQLQFAYSEYGRPSLANTASCASIEFNISHGGGFALLAFSRFHRIGVDVEKVRRDFEPLDISENYFSLSERAVLRGVPAELRHEAFFRCWTRKEAFIKALGEGLSHPLDAFDVSIAPGSTAALLSTRPNGDEAARWMLRDVAVPEDYVAALAVELNRGNE